MFRDEWDFIYKRYAKPLYLYALSLTGNGYDAEDLLHNTFVKAYLSYKQNGNIKYWLITVLKNEFLNLQRKKKREVLDGGENILKRQSANIDILNTIIKTEERQALFHAILELPVPMKEVLMESVYFHMKDKEIARLHQLTEENVRKIRSRAKQKLMKKMKEGSL